MGSNKRKRRVRYQRNQIRRHKMSIVMISAVLLLLVVVVSANIRDLQSRNQVQIEREMELKAQIEEERLREKDIEYLEIHIQTPEYIMELAREKLGLVYPNEIIFRPVR